MRNKILCILIFISIASIEVSGQEASSPLQGEISYITSKNIYVKFSNTEDISIGDTLKLMDKNLACLIVTNKSSISCVCEKIDDCEVNKGDNVFYYYPIRGSNASVVKVINTDILEEPPTIDKDSLKIVSLYEENIRARLSLSAYDLLGSEREDRHRIMARFSLKALHFNDSKFSFETYMNYRQNVFTNESTNINSEGSFRVYNLALRFDASPTLHFEFGRKINPRAWSVGAIDGLQVEKNFGKVYTGAIVGFRPNLYDYGFDPNLFEYGVYIGKVNNGEKYHSETTLGYIEQRNTNSIDRRYIFLQYTSTLFKKLHLFSSMELDLFKKVNEVSSTDPRLTNLYLSARYRFNKKVDLSLSYDSRKRIIYYESFQSDIERLLDDDIARQGLRARINIRPLKFISLGFSYSNRFQSDFDNKSENYYSYLNFSRIPAIGGRILVSYNVNNSNYLKSNIVSFRYSRTIIKRKLNADFYYRYVNYLYYNDSSPLDQNYLGTNLSYNFTRKLSLSVAFEFSSFNNENNYRIYSKIAKRFYKDRKK